MASLRGGSPPQAAVELAAHQPLQVDADGAEALFEKGAHQGAALSRIDPALQGTGELIGRQLDAGRIPLAAHPHLWPALLP